ncbi:MAG TPA: hypothetical protein VLT16_14430 [Candidatus Limnocylindrales bacterium]|nr:hypothetical protein [Candidatus Limnocylindrales bacterium]
MENRFCRMLFAVIALMGLSASAQVLALGKVSDPASRLAQKQYSRQLQQLASDASALRFPYPFYFSQALDVDEAQQKQLPQGSIHFDQFNGQTVLEITGNYYISYSTQMLNANQRARKTYQDVVLPLLKVAVARMDRSVPFQAYAFEISHHVRRKVLNVDTEGPENVMMFFPRMVAERLSHATDTETQQAALLESEIYVNGEPFTLWLTGDDAPEDVKDHYLARHDPKAASAASPKTEMPEPGTLVSPSLIPQSELLNQIRARESAPKDLSPLRMEKLQTRYDATLQRLAADLKPQAHFVDYAPPAFIAFHNGAYLQLNVNTDLEPMAGASQYRVAALAFDSHISHLLRPVAKYFQDDPQFEGVDFSATVHQPSQAGGQSVEFVVPFAALECYAKYDCTGQELINRSVILINGERVSLDLQRAEAEPMAGLR